VDTSLKGGKSPFFHALFVLSPHATCLPLTEKRLSLRLASQPVRRAAYQTDEDECANDALLFAGWLEYTPRTEGGDCQPGWERERDGASELSVGRGGEKGAPERKSKEGRGRRWKKKR